MAWHGIPDAQICLFCRATLTVTSSRRWDRKPRRQNRSNNLSPESLCDNSRSHLGRRRTRRAQSQEQVRGSGCHLRDPSPKPSRSGPEGKAQPTASPREDAAHPQACFRGLRGVVSVYLTLSADGDGTPWIPGGR